MVSERRRAGLTKGLDAFVPQGLAATVVASDRDLDAVARIARTLVELPVAISGASLIVSKNRGAGAALRGARELGAEPRVLRPSSAEGLSVRTPLSLALQGDRSLPAFAAACGFIADFAAHHAAPKGGLPDPALRAKVASSFSKARDKAKPGLDLAAVAEAAWTALGASHPGRAKVKEAFALLAACEAASQAYSSPLGWAALLAPAPSGRRAVVWIDLSALPPSAAAEVEALALASLAAQLNELKVSLEGAPVFVLADTPAHALGRFAAERLASWQAAETPAVFALFVAPPRPGGPEGFPEATVGEGGLHLPGREAPLPLPELGGPAVALRPEELAALTPPSLRARLLGGGGGEEEVESDAFTEVEGSAPSARESYSALKAAAGDLEELARRRTAAAAAKPPARKGPDYEVSDFELK